jgi:hypothetical protein
MAVDAEEPGASVDEAPPMAPVDPLPVALLPTVLLPRVVLPRVVLPFALEPKVLLPNVVLPFVVEPKVLLPAEVDDPDRPVVPAVPALPGEIVPGATGAPAVEPLALVLPKLLVHGAPRVDAPLDVCAVTRPGRAARAVKASAAVMCLAEVCMSCS